MIVRDVKAFGRWGLSAERRSIRTIQPSSATSIVSMSPVTRLRSQFVILALKAGSTEVGPAREV